MARSRKYVLDSSVFIHSPYIPEGYTVPGVLSEIRSEKKYLLESLVGSGVVLVVEPGEEYVRRVKREAENLGELKKLSSTDISLLALSLEKDCILFTDDFHLQNVAGFLGVDFEGFFKIRRKIKWVRKCTRCRRRVNSEVCPYCGGLTAYFSN